MDLTVATANVLHAKQPWSPLADVVGWQEADKVRWSRAARKAAEKVGHALWVPGGAAAREVTISWNEAVGKIQGGGSVLTHRGLKAVSPNRWIAYVLLELADGSTLLHLNTHMVSGVRRQNSSEHFWRRARWYRHDVIQQALVSIALGQPVRPPAKTKGGKFPGWWNDLQPRLTRFAVQMAKAKPDHVVATGDYNQIPTRTEIPGLSVAYSFRKDGIDQIHYSASLSVGQPRNLPREQSDHPPFVVTVNTLGAAPTPPTPPEDVVTVDPETAIARARSRQRAGTRIAGGAGWCLREVRTLYGVPAAAPDATTAWQWAKHKHRTERTSTIPRGVPIFWTGGSKGHGHIAISAGDGDCYTTDLPTSGRWGWVRIDDITRKWGLDFAGWTEDLNGVRVWTKAEPEPTPPAPEPLKPAKDRAAQLIEMILAEKDVTRPDVEALLKAAATALRAGKIKAAS